MESTEKPGAEVTPKAKEKGPFYLRKLDKEYSELSDLRPVQNVLAVYRITDEENDGCWPDTLIPVHAMALGKARKMGAAGEFRKEPVYFVYSSLTGFEWVEDYPSTNERLVTCFQGSIQDFLRLYPSGIYPDGECAGCMPMDEQKRLRDANFGRIQIENGTKQA